TAASALARRPRIAIALTDATAARRSPRTLLVLVRAKFLDDTRDRRRRDSAVRKSALEFRGDVADDERAASLRQRKRNRERDEADPFVVDVFRRSAVCDVAHNREADVREMRANLMHAACFRSALEE